jgi:uncharacterized Zn-binding protein involved in type VI secretion
MAQAALRLGDMITCSLSDGSKPHVGGAITAVATVPTVTINGRAAAVANGLPGGIPCVSPAPNGLASGSKTVMIGSQPAARVGDSTLHGQKATPGPGSPDVQIG